jgi:hypothetical protein
LKKGQVWRVVEVVLRYMVRKRVSLKMLRELLKPQAKEEEAAA